MRLGGALLAPGWHRGTAALELGAADVGAGVAARGGDGRRRHGRSAPRLPAPWRRSKASCAATKLQPCPPTATRAVAVDTTRLADGAHTLRGCATDFAGGQGCAADVRIEVDNSPPAISFAAAAEGAGGGDGERRVLGAGVGDDLGAPRRRRELDRPADRARRDGAGTATLSARLPDLAPAPTSSAPSPPTRRERRLGRAPGRGQRRRKVRRQAAAGTGGKRRRRPGRRRSGAAAPRHPPHRRLLAGRGAGRRPPLLVDAGRAADGRGRPRTGGRS